MAKRMEWFPPGVSFDERPVVLHDETLLPMRILRDVEGLEAPVFSFTSSSTPGVDGVEFGEVTATRPRVSLPVFLWAESEEHLHRAKSELIASLNPKRGTGRLLQSVGMGQEPGTGKRSGEARYVWARYRGGLEGRGVDIGPEWWRFTVTFEAADPFWYSVDPVRATWQGLPSEPFFPVTFPMVLSKSGVEPTAELVVSGDGETWPSFDLVGPFTSVTVRPADDDEVFWQISRPTSEAEMVRVVTKPGDESITAWVSDGFGGWFPAPDPNAYPDLEAQSWFVPLGFQDELVVTASGTSSSTRVELTAAEAWWSQ